MLSRAMLLFALFLTGAACADSYDVQIGAFRNPDATKIDLPANVGELRRATGPKGLTRFLVGPFDSRDAAEQVRKKLAAAGFDGAFIRAAQSGQDSIQVNASTRSAPVSSAETQEHSIQSETSSISQSNLDKLMSLSEEERLGVVFLDGKLHRKVGDEFIPLRD